MYSKTAGLLGATIMALGFDVYDKPAGATISNWADRAQDVVIRTGQHGFLSLDCFVPMGTQEAHWFYNLGYVPH